MLIESKGDAGYIYIYISDDEEYDALRQLIKEIPIEEYKYRPSFFGNGDGYFISEGVYVKIEYMMVGMFLSVTDSISDSDLNKFRQWAARLYELSKDERFSFPDRD